MEPIVSPWIVYLLGIVSNLRILLLVSFVVMCCGTIFCGICWIGEASDGKKESARRFKISFKKSLISAVVLFVLWVFVPSRNTLIGMVVAKNVTYNRVDKTIDKTAEVGKQLHQVFKKDILELIDRLNNGGQEKESREDRVSKKEAKPK